MLMSCIVAWRRAVLEAHYREGAEPHVLDEKRSALTWYAQGAGGTGPFTEHLLCMRVGELDEPLFLEALYRIESATSIAWALGLLASIPPVEEGAEFEALSNLFPLDGAPGASTRDARLRDPQELFHQGLEWKRLTAAARKRCDEFPGEPAAAIQFSRAFERSRGLVWVSSNAGWLEDTGLDV
jgi:hypothetical protein